MRRVVIILFLQKNASCLGICLKNKEIFVNTLFANYMVGNAELNNGIERLNKYGRGNYFFYCNKNCENSNTRRLIDYSRL